MAPEEIKIDDVGTQGGVALCAWPGHDLTCAHGGSGLRVSWGLVGAMQKAPPCNRFLYKLGWLAEVHRGLRPGYRGLLPSVHTSD